MNHQAPRRYSQKRNFGVEGQEDFASDTSPRRSNDNRVRKAPYNGSRNLVWTPKEFQASEKKNDNSYGSMNSPRSSSTPGSRVWSSKSRVCVYWKAGNCKKGDQCRFLHSWCSFPGLAMVATLEGHKKELKGIAFPQDSDKIYSASIDGALRIWDCHSCKCVQETNLQAEAGSLISEGSWVFLGFPNTVKAFNIRTCRDLQLSGLVNGQVNAIAAGNGMVFAGTSSGSISVWRATGTEMNPFEYVTLLEGHNGEVKCFSVRGGHMLYSGSTDGTIKTWDLNTLQCTMTLKQHSDTVTSLLCWDRYLLSSSLDKTIKVWGSSEENGSLEVIHTVKQEQSVHTLCGLLDAEEKPIIFCSFRDGSVGIYDLPSFEERGKMFSKNTIETITIGPNRLLLSGDKSGELRVWSLSGNNNKV